MLSVYTRHYPPCRQTDANYRRCRCPKWINGTLATGKFIRESAQTRSWETAERKARLMEIDPRYADCIVRRWQEYTGKHAVHEDGHTFDEISTCRTTAAA